MSLLASILVNKWFFTFVVGWVLFYMFVERSSLRINIWGGVAASALQVMHDFDAGKMDLYNFQYAGIWLFGLSAFFTFGITFTMGVLFLQFMPTNAILRIIHALAFAVGFLLFEYIVVSYGALRHAHYSYLISFVDNLYVLPTIGWVKQFVLYTRTREI